MCDLHSHLEEAKARHYSTRRLKLWEIRQGWHCAIIGTCLTMSELRSLFRKSRLRICNPDGTDFQLHSLFVQEALTKSRSCKLMNKLLDKKYAVTIRQFQKCESQNDIRAQWKTARENGMIPGAFWAVMSHPLTGDSLGTEIYGEVHMLSHLVGAANHADIRTLNRLEEDMATMRETVENDRRRYREKIAEKDEYISILQTEAVELKARAAASVASPSVTVETKLADRLNETRNTVLDLRHDLTELTAKCSTLEEINAGLEDRNRNLANEIRMLESTLEPEDGETDGPKCPFDLNGRCILYVGGRSPQVCHMRKLVNQWNGELLHHDGGVERSIDELARTVSKADTVVFPTDCVSHSAIHTVKRICRQNMKPYVPLRSTGVASLVAGLKKEFTENQTVN